MLKRPEAMEFALSRFARAVVKQARTNLTRKGHKFSGDLSKSLDNWSVRVTQNSVYISFAMEEYGDFQDLGVKGAANFKSHKMQRFTPYKYKDRVPPARALREWARSKGRNEYAVARNIYKRGIPQTLFFTKAFESQFNNLPETILDVFGRDIEDALRYSRQRKR